MLFQLLMANVPEADLFFKGIRPAINVGLSVSRVLLLKLKL
jgi:hypothetical protein